MRDRGVDRRAFLVLDEAAGGIDRDIGRVQLMAHAHLEGTTGGIGILQARIGVRRRLRLHGSTSRGVDVIRDLRTHPDGTGKLA